MNKTLQLVSVQHELGMAIGLDLRLEPMLQQFTRVCARRLGLAGVDYYFLNSSQGGLICAPKCNATYKYFLSIPALNDGDVLPVLPVFSQAYLSERCTCVERYMRDSDQYIYYFNIQNFGFIVLRRFNKAIAKNILELLKPIIQRLSVSCQASIEHEKLLDAIAAKESAEEILNYRLLHDELTGLPNRQMLMSAIDSAIQEGVAQRCFGAIFFIDLNRFKTINDTLGHSVGDQLLIAIAQLLVDIVADDGVVSRLSGDEFVILFPKILSSTQVDDYVTGFYKRIQREFTKAILAGDYRLNITPSIGISIFSQNKKSAEQILQHADIAMYHAKGIGPNEVSFYNKEMSLELESRLKIEKELHAAVKELKEFEMVYQPQYNDEAECIGAEALLRWHSPVLGLVSPADFIPIAENTGLMLPLGQWVINEVCRRLKTLMTKGLPAGFKSISVNVSALQFSQKYFVSDLLAAISDAGIPNELLRVELTESVLINNVEEMVVKMGELQSNNIFVSVDDFGTGYSSLSYLSRFPVKTLKVDQAFVRDIHLDPNNLAIVGTIMSLGDSLGLAVIAEGVETPQELECLKRLGCTLYQGYYFSRPIAFTQLQALLKDMIKLKIVG